MSQRKLHSVLLFLFIHMSTSPLSHSTGPSSPDYVSAPPETCARERMRVREFRHAQSAVTFSAAAIAEVIRNGGGKGEGAPVSVAFPTGATPKGTVQTSIPPRYF